MVIREKYLDISAAKKASCRKLVLVKVFVFQGDKVATRDIVRIGLKFYEKTITFWKSAFRPSLKLIVIFCTNAKPAHL
jgi:hypothetical protein